MEMCCARCKFLKGNTVNPYDHCENNKLKLVEILKDKNISDEMREDIYDKVNKPLRYFIEKGPDWENCINNDSKYYNQHIDNHEKFHCDKFIYDEEQDKINQRFLKEEVYGRKHPLYHPNQPYDRYGNIDWKVWY